jgi:hypothetical protein
MKTVTQLLWLLLIAVLTMTVDGLYFEYCLSRDLPIFFNTGLLFVIIGVNLVAGIGAVKIIVKLLKL